MKHILTFILSLCFFASIGQVRLSDTANNGTFSYHLGSNFRGQYPKGSCYLDRDASGAFAIRRVTGAVVTPYVSMSNYVLNGEVDTVFSSYIEKLNGIIMLSCGGVTPIETFAYCGAPVWDFWDENSGYSDTITLCESGGGNCPLVYASDIYQLHIWNAERPYTEYPYGGCVFSGNTCEQIDSCISILGLQCSNFDYFNVTANGVQYNEIDSSLCPAETMNIPSQLYNLSVVQFDTVELYLEGNTVSNDTIISQYTTVPIGGSANSVLRTLGVVLSDINLDTTNATIEITAKPVKTSGTTYEASSFKIEKIAFANISAGTISGSTYNPNLGEQSNTFSLTTGKNTFKVSVEDTDGNIAYSIFQVTKTAL